MTSYVALLRGINVGGHNKLAMADLREALEAAGFLRVRTYIQSGNVVFEHRRRKTDTLASDVHSVIQARFDLDVPVVVFDGAELGTVVDASPFAEEPDPKRVHVFFLASELDPPARRRLDELEAAARARGSADRVIASGRTVYLHTPTGFGTSDLAKALSSRAPGAMRDGTARNWSTVRVLLDMCAP